MGRLADKDPQSAALAADGGLDAGAVFVALPRGEVEQLAGSSPRTAGVEAIALQRAFDTGLEGVTQF